MDTSQTSETTLIDRDQIGKQNNFAPRLGFVLAPTSSDRTIIRGGVGLFHLFFRLCALGSVRSGVGMGDGAQTAKVQVAGRMQQSLDGADILGQGQQGLEKVGVGVGLVHFG